jgi:hypothetical protein
MIGCGIILIIKKLEVGVVSFIKDPHPCMDREMNKFIAALETTLKYFLMHSQVVVVILLLVTGSGSGQG